jgi:NAD(P)-dependent dehydrogenase (short-subunit alcohol dehydrogenase family)
MTNRTHLLLGGGGDIGRALAGHLLGRGEAVVVAGRPSERLTATAKELGVEPLELDARVPEEVEAAARASIERHGRLDSIVNLVGSVLLKPAHSTSLDEFDDTLRINLHTAFAAVRAAGKTMRKAGGSVVLMSSAAARVGLPNHEAVAAAKAGVIGLGLSAAASYSRYGIRVNVVAPGLVQTALTAKITSNEASAQASEALHPAGRLGEPNDVASMLAWLLGADQTWVTGQVFGVDGGLATLKVQR